MADPRHELGRHGEDLAARHLKREGYQLVARNLVNAFGELDLVLLRGELVVVVEVKTRSQNGRRPAEAVDFRKRRKLTQIAALFLKNRQWQNRPIRFDVVEVICPPGGFPVIHHIPHAFDAVDY